MNGAILGSDCEEFISIWGIAQCARAVCHKESGGGNLLAGSVGRSGTTGKVEEFLAG